MWRALVLAGLLALTPSAAQVSERPASVRVTVYHSGGEGDPSAFADPAPNEGLAFITEVRTIDVPAGPTTIEFRGVASTIIPQTAAIDGLPVPLLERNFDYDLLSPGSLIGKSVGETVTLVRTDKKTGKTTERKAVIRTGPNGVVLDFGGSYEALDCSGLPERLVFSKVPDGLRDTPTLSIRTNARQAGRYTIKLSYLATDVNWAANYVARIHGDRLDLSGWVTLVNAGETSFKDVPLDIVAGTVARQEDEDKAVEPTHLYHWGYCWPTNIKWSRTLRKMIDAIQSEDIGRFPDAAPAAALQRVPGETMEAVTVTGMRASQDLGDYKLYSLNGTTDVNARQTKQIQLLDQKDVPFQRIYYMTISSDEEQHAAAVVLRMKNSKKNNLGLALPAGLFTATELSDDHAPVVLNRTGFRDFSVDSPIELELGSAMDVYVRGKEISRETIRRSSGDKVRSTGEITIENHKAAAIDFELRLPVSDQIKLIDESLSHAVRSRSLIRSSAPAAAMLSSPSLRSWGVRVSGKGARIRNDAPFASRRSAV
jgi:hypothetical protein